MTHPSHPTRFLKEGPASPCVLHGVNLTWKNCTCLACGMGMNKSTLGRVDMSGCAVREETNDHAGGTMLSQMEAIASAHGVKTELHVGSNVASLWYNAYQGARGRGFILQGNTQPDGRGNVNHAVWVNEPYGGTPGDPDGFIVWDPWSSGPAKWSYAKTKAFALALRPFGEDDPRTLKNMGINGVYSLIFPDTEPHAHLHYGASHTSPFPDHQTIHSPVPGERVIVRGGPGKQYPVKRTEPSGTAWTSYQVVRNGGLDRGSRVWYGGHAGRDWVHESGLSGKGGTR